MIEIPSRFCYAKPRIEKFIENPLGYLGYKLIDSRHPDAGSNRTIYGLWALELRRAAILGYLNGMLDVGLIDDAFYKQVEEYITSSDAINEDMDIMDKFKEVRQ